VIEQRNPGTDLGNRLRNQAKRGLRSKSSASFVAEFHGMNEIELMWWDNGPMVRG
jgi:hypothetical protein